MLLSPCMLFGVFGLLHSREIGWPNGWMFTYLVADILLLSGVAVIWWFANRWRPRARLDACRECGYSLKSTAGTRCPECGLPRHG